MLEKITELANKEKENIVKKYYLPHDVHFNKHGNKLLAKNFLENSDY